MPAITLKLLFSLLFNKITFYIAAGLLSWGLIWFAGYNSGVDKMEAKYRANQQILEQRISEYRNKFETELEQKEILQKALIEELNKQDEEAINDPESTNRCISPNGLQRLNKGFGYR